MAGLELDRAGIEEILPHRSPFLFLARATIVEPGIWATGRLPEITPLLSVILNLVQDLALLEIPKQVRNDNLGTNWGKVR